MFLVYVAINYFCIAAAKERTASLVVLPPLVIGYDDLYEETKDTENNDKPKKTRLEDYSIVELDSGNDTDGDNHSVHSEHSDGETKVPDSNEVTDHPPTDHDRNPGNVTCDQKLRQVEIVGKLIIPDRIFGCDDGSDKEKKTPNNRL